MDAAPKPCVDLAERARLAASVDGFIAGQSSIAGLRGEAYRFLQARDPAVAAVADLLYSLCRHDFWARRRRWGQLRDIERHAIERCRLFLGTPLPYEWPDLPHQILVDWAGAAIVVIGMGALGHLVFALVVGALGIWRWDLLLIANAVMLVLAGGAVITGMAFARNALHEWTAAACQDYERAGDRAAWPFLRHQDCEQALASR
jgi:hypothetical protein